MIFLSVVICKRNICIVRNEIASLLLYFVILIYLFSLL